MVAGSGGVVGYAWYDNDFRTKLEGIHPQVKQQFDRILPVAEKPTPVIKKKFVLPVYDSHHIHHGCCYYNKILEGKTQEYEHFVKLGVNFDH